MVGTIFARSLIILALACSISFGANAQKKVVFVCKNGETKEFMKMLDQITHLNDYYENKKLPHDIVLLSQGDCSKFMLSDLDDTRWTNEETPFEMELKLDKLKNKVRFEQCQNTLDRMNISNKKLRTFIRPIQSATVSAVEYQLGGYAIMTQ